MNNSTSKIMNLLFDLECSKKKNRSLISESIRFFRMWDSLLPNKYLPECDGLTILDNSIRIFWKIKKYPEDTEVLIMQIEETLNATLIHIHVSSAESHKTITENRNLEEFEIILDTLGNIIRRS